LKINHLKEKIFFGKPFFQKFLKTRHNRTQHAAISLRPEGQSVWKSLGTLKVVPSAVTKPSSVMKLALIRRAHNKKDTDLPLLKKIY